MMLLLVAGLPVGCSHDVEVTLRDEIAVTTRVTGLQKRIVSVDDNATLQTKDIKIDAYFHDTDTKYLNGVKLHYDSSEPASWKFWEADAQKHYYWPIEGSVYTGVVPNITVSSLDFVGYCPFTKPDYITSTSYNHSTGASFTCNVADSMTNATQKDMQEYVIAVLKNQTPATQSAAGGALPMSFKHPFVLIRFVITAGSGTHVQVDSIGIAGLNTIGTCTYNGSTMSWGSYDGSATLSIEPANPLKYGTSYTVSDTMMVIPKNYGTKTLVVKGTWDEWTDSVTKEISADVAINWEPGYIYTYNLTVTKYALKVDVQKFTEQW